MTFIRKINNSFFPLANSIRGHSVYGLAVRFWTIRNRLLNHIHIICARLPLPDVCIHTLCTVLTFSLKVYTQRFQEESIFYI